VQRVSLHAFAQRARRWEEEEGSWSQESAIVSVSRLRALVVYSCRLSVVETEDIVVHVEVLRVGLSRQEEEHLSELQRILLALNLHEANHTQNAHSERRDKHMT